MDINESFWAEPPEQKSKQIEPGDIKYIWNPATIRMEAHFSDRLCDQIANAIIEGCKPIAREAGLSIRSFMRRTLLSMADKVE